MPDEPDTDTTDVTETATEHVETTKRVAHSGPDQGGPPRADRPAEGGKRADPAD